MSTSKLKPEKNTTGIIHSTSHSYHVSDKSEKLKVEEKRSQSF